MLVTMEATHWHRAAPIRAPQLALRPPTPTRCIRAPRTETGRRSHRAASCRRSRRPTTVCARCMTTGRWPRPSIQTWVLAVGPRGAGTVAVWLWPATLSWKDLWRLLPRFLRWGTVDARRAGSDWCMPQCIIALHIETRTAFPSLLRSPPRALHRAQPSPFPHHKPVPSQVSPAITPTPATHPHPHIPSHAPSNPHPKPPSRSRPSAPATATPRASWAPTSG
jgi:hypothetical protein